MSDFILEEQEQTEWCWAAVSKSIFGYFDSSNPLKQCEIAGTFLNKDCGCTSGVLASGCNTGASLELVMETCNTLRGPGLKVTVAPTGTVTFDQIREELDSGFPLCARIQWFGNPLRAHFVIIIGYSLFEGGQAWLDIADPLKEASMMVPFPSFQSNYQGAGQWHQTYLLRKK